MLILRPLRCCDTSDIIQHTHSPGLPISNKHIMGLNCKLFLVSWTLVGEITSVYAGMCHITLSCAYLVWYFVVLGWQKFDSFKAIDSSCYCIEITVLYMIGCMMPPILLQRLLPHSYPWTQCWFTYSFLWDYSKPRCNLFIFGPFAEYILNLENKASHWV